MTLNEFWARMNRGEARRRLSLLLICLLITSAACVRQPEPPAGPETTGEDNAVSSVTIAVGGSVFYAKLYDNDTAAAFLKRLPLALNMSELNGNEKYFYLPDSLPADAARVGSVNAGDLMLYGSDCLVLFYESFATSYSYTKLGYIENVSGLADALGRGGAEVQFSKISPPVEMVTTRHGIIFPQF